MKKQIVWLIVAGSLLNGLNLLSQRFFDLPDFANGLIQGIGVGLLLLAVIKQSQYRTQAK